MSIIRRENILLERKYRTTAYWYDILDYPWERKYRHWRPNILKNVEGNVLEAGVGTGRNLQYYSQNVNLTGIDMSASMLSYAKKRQKEASCRVKLLQDDATIMENLSDNSFDWVISTFMCCVVPNNLQPLVLQQIARVLKPGGKFRLVEMIFSKNQARAFKQSLFLPFVEKVYGARFDRQTLSFLEENPNLETVKTSFLQDDTYLLIEGRKIHQE